jgi:hypothetical protein
MSSQRPRFRFVAVSALAAGSLVLTSTGIARQDAFSLPGGNPSWRAHAIAAQPILSEADDLLRTVSAPWASAAALDDAGFALADLEPEPPMTALAEKPAPFFDRTLRGDRLAPPVRGHAVTDSTYAQSPGAAAASGSTGSDARHGSTPAYPVGDTSTPAFGEAPVAVAALPVLTPDERRALVVAARFAPDGESGLGGVTEAERGVDAAGRSSTRLSHSILIPEGELDKQQRCLAEAVYFEARGEPVRGQYAVAQVVMNRTRTGFYPNTICKVVYQNRHRYNACQFSFACDRFPDRIYNRPAWALAERIARDVTENRAWLDDVGGATHYHADYVHPYWRRDMIKESTIGRHIFYRARSLPHLGPPATISEAPGAARSGEAS